MKSGLEDKSESLANKMNKLTAKITNNIELSDELELSGDDIIEFVETKTQEVSLFSGETAEIINLNSMVEDFKFVRETLKENTENGRRVLNCITLDLLDSDDDKRASLIMSFAELNKAVADNMRLYISAYKDLSNVLLNINKLNQQDIGNDNRSDSAAQAISTVDLIRQLSNKGN